MKSAERHQLGAVVADVRSWTDAAADVRGLASHLPVSGRIPLTDADLELIVPLEAVGQTDDAEEAARLAATVWFPGRRRLQPAHEAAERILLLHSGTKAIAGDQRLSQLQAQLTRRAVAERAQLIEILRELHAAGAAITTMLDRAKHLLFTRASALSDEESAAADHIKHVIDSHYSLAASLLESTSCVSGDCTAAHAAARTMAAAHAIAASSGALQAIDGAAARVALQLSNERTQLSSRLRELDRWRTAAESALHNTTHLPITRSGALSNPEVAAMSRLSAVWAAHAERSMLFDPETHCPSNVCEAFHTPVAAIGAYYESAIRSGEAQTIVDASTRVAAQSVEERRQLRSILDDLDLWHAETRRAQKESAHLPLAHGALTHIELTAMKALDDAVQDNAADAALLLRDETCAEGGCAAAHRSALVLHDLHAAWTTSGDAQTVLDARERVTAQLITERGHLKAALEDADQWYTASKQATSDAEHLALTRNNALSTSELAAMADLHGVMESHYLNAQQLVDGDSCTLDDCAEHHASASALHKFHAEWLQAGTAIEIMAAAERIAAQRTQERRTAASFRQEASTWAARVLDIKTSRKDALAKVRSRTARLVDESTAIEIAGTAVRLLPLREEHESLVAALTLLRDYSLTQDHKKLLKEAERLASAVDAAVTEGFTQKFDCRSRGKCARAHRDFTAAYEAGKAIPARLQSLTVNIGDLPNRLEDLLDPTLGLISHLPAQYGNPELLPVDLRAATVGGKLEEIVNAQTIAKKAAADAKEAADKVRATDVANALKEMDLEVLRKAAPHEKIRISPLEAYDLRNVWDVLKFQEKYVLESLPGLGAASAIGIMQASLRLFQAVRDETPVRIDVKRRKKSTAVLLEKLRAWDNARRFEPTPDEVSLAHGLLSVLQTETKKWTPDRVITVAVGPPGEGDVSVADVLTSALERAALPYTETDIWADFLARPADYFGMLTELGFVTEDELKMHGDLPEEIVEAVRAKELRRDFLTASLRTYQSFGARFALAQEKVVIGDEMGLGKTVEALAVFTHLRATGRSHFLVVSPAAVVSNWMRETVKHTKLRAYRLHGAMSERKYAAKSWQRNGGVAVVTYDLLPWALEFLELVDVGCAVFDEAHYIKNPNAKRSLAAATLMDSVKYVVLMTGTPLENSVQEFRNLIGFIRPDLSESAPEYLASAFRKHVAPAYLRRNQEDVLTELPDLVEVDEWLGMSAEDERIYRDAVHDGHFMRMRRAGLLSGNSQKLDRLREIVREAEANGRRVIVFSYFREVLNEIADTLPGAVFGPLTGSMPAADRQGLIDRFSGAEHGAVLVAQITAGGVGLNIQAASVVVICEPQIKPTMEAQAIARAHRMGQTLTVQVHRLLTENSVDERIRDILADKRMLFDEFARDSVIAKQAPDAVDITEADIARIVVASERERLFSRL